MIIPITIVAMLVVAAFYLIFRRFTFFPQTIFQVLDTPIATQATLLNIFIYFVWSYQFAVLLYVDLYFLVPASASLILLMIRRYNQRVVRQAERRLLEYNDRLRRTPSPVPEHNSRVRPRRLPRYSGSTDGSRFQSVTSDNRRSSSSVSSSSSVTSDRRSVTPQPSHVHTPRFSSPSIYDSDDDVNDSQSVSESVHSNFSSSTGYHTADGNRTPTRRALSPRASSVSSSSSSDAYYAADGNRTPTRRALSPRASSVSSSSSSDAYYAADGNRTATRRSLSPRANSVSSDGTSVEAVEALLTGTGQGTYGVYDDDDIYTDEEYEDDNHSSVVNRAPVAPAVVQASVAPAVVQASVAPAVIQAPVAPAVIQAPVAPAVIQAPVVNLAPVVANPNCRGCLGGPGGYCSCT